VADLLTAVEGKTPRAPQHVWFALAPPQRSPPTVRLFCFAHAGGSGTVFGALRRALAPEIEVCPLELPGHGHRFAEPPADDLSKLAGDVAHVLDPHLGQRFALFGHSFGALLSFEVARELVRRDRPQPLALYVSAAPAPHSFAARVAAAPASSIVPDAVRRDPEHMRRAEMVMAATARSIRSARIPRESLGIPIVGVLGTNDPVAGTSDLAGWRTYGSCFLGPFQIPGDHFYVSGQGQALAAIVRQTLFVLTGSSGREVS